MKKGIYNITAEEYFALDRVSNSYLKRLATVPALAKKEYKTTPAMAFGTACHTYVLEPATFDEQIAVLPKIDRRTKKGKEIYNVFVAESKGKTVISADEFKAIESIGESIQGHPGASHLLNEGIAEQSVIWEEKRTGLECKARPDWLKKDGIVVDLKTTKNASRHGFLQEAVKYSYYTQAAFYLKGLNHAAPKENYDRFIFVAVEKVPPFRVECYELSDEFLEYGYYKFQAALALEAKCREENYWPPYSEAGVNVLEKPKYL